MMQRVESPASCLSRGKLKLQDLWRSRPSRHPCRDSKGDKWFWTLVSGLPLRPCAGWSPSTPRGRGRLGQRVHEWSHGEASVRVPTSTLHLTPPGALLGSSPTEESGPGDSILAHLPATRGPRARPRLFPASGPVFLVWETRLCPPTPNPIPTRSAPAGPSSPSSPLTWLWDPVPVQTLLPAPPRSPGSSEGETRRAPGPRPTSR